MHFQNCCNNTLVIIIIIIILVIIDNIITALCTIKKYSNKDRPKWLEIAVFHKYHRYLQNMGHGIPTSKKTKNAPHHPDRMPCMSTLCVLALRFEPRSLAYRSSTLPLGYEALCMISQQLIDLIKK